MFELAYFFELILFKNILNKNIDASRNKKIKKYLINKPFFKKIKLTQDLPSHKQKSVEFIYFYSFTKT